jgi:hypothetical protein
VHPAGAALDGHLRISRDHIAAREPVAAGLDSVDCAAAACRRPLGEAVNSGRSASRQYAKGGGAEEDEEYVMNDAETMKTYVAEINGEAVMAFRATDDDDARDMASDEDGDLQQSLNDSSGVTREDGSPLWDGKSEIRVRPATEAEDEDWRTARDAEIENADGDELIDSETEDDFDDFNVYLIPVKLADDEEGDTTAA